MTPINFLIEIMSKNFINILIVLFTGNLMKNGQQQKILRGSTGVFKTNFPGIADAKFPLAVNGLGNCAEPEAKDLAK